MTTSANGLSTQELERKLNFLQGLPSSAYFSPPTHAFHSLGVLPFDSTPYADLYSCSENLRALCCIVNTQPASQPGEHWVAFYRAAHAFHIEYFDSYGRPPEKYGFRTSISSAPDPHGLKTIYSNFPLQGYGSNVCGHYCLLFIYFRRKLNSLTSTINLLCSLGRNPAARDQKVKQLYSSIRIHKLPQALLTPPQYPYACSSADSSIPTLNLNLSQSSSPNPLMHID